MPSKLVWDPKASMYLQGSPDAGQPSMNAVGSALGLSGQADQTPAPAQGMDYMNPYQMNQGPSAQGQSVDMMRYTGGQASQPDANQAPVGVGDFGLYDPEYETGMQDIMSQRNQAESDYTYGQNQLQQQYQPQFDVMDQSYQDQMDQLRASLAGSGILRSSNALYGQGVLNTGYQSQVGDLLAKQRGQSEGLSANRLNTLTGLGGRQSALERSHADRLDEDARVRAREQANAEAAQQAQAAWEQENQRIQNQLTPNATGQLQPAQPAATDPQHTPVQPDYGSNWTYQNMADTMLRDWQTQLPQVENNPFMMQKARESWQAANQNNPQLAPLLQGGMFDEIRRRLGL